MTTLSVQPDLAPPPPAATVKVLRPRRGFERLDTTQLWRYRELLSFLAWRDIKVRYKQTLLGATWAIIQPLLTMVVLSLFFGRVIDLTDRTGKVPYPIFLYAGLLPWTFFSSAVTAATNSLVNNAHMLRKIYFPRLLVPVASIGVPLIDYLMASSVLLALMAWYRLAPTPAFLLIPALFGLTFIAALGIGVGMAALTVSYRDSRYLVPFFIQLGFFITPVIYPVTILSEKWRWVLWLNPVGGTITAFRDAVLGTPIDYSAVAVSGAMSVALLVVGLIYFARAQRRFADVV
ncbi:MAG: ABC transporter permease [Planctomycetes bacterium]|nr:ABC transporter permease [Planctomycetota bacterium]